ncbi:Hypp7466 [Branchiostoma lanceolatum]|uniref:Hypp7466 protein n=1 Tax=Branchiostoma lanceolatum TaxID=7740 RepID=A0A8K0EDV4_BRALA|nr:Hypp7466 [Branchiostoma lanceolatum]
MRMCKEKYTFHVSWQPYLLRPNMPPDGIEKPPQYKGVSDHLKAAGQSVGIDFTGKCPRFPNTIQAHCLLEHAGKVPDGGKTQDKLAEVLFRAYFTDGMYPSGYNLVELAKEVGMTQEEVEPVITSQENQTAIFNKAGQYMKDGVTGVPFFYINGRPAFSGAQDPGNFVYCFQKAAEKFPAGKGGASQSSM